MLSPKILFIYTIRKYLPCTILWLITGSSYFFSYLLLFYCGRATWIKKKDQFQVEKLVNTWKVIKPSIIVMIIFLLPIFPFATLLGSYIIRAVLGSEDRRIECKAVFLCLAYNKWCCTVSCGKNLSLRNLLNFLYICIQSGISG